MALSRLVPSQGRKIAASQKEKKTYQRLLAIRLMPHPNRIHPQRDLLPLRTNTQNLLPQRELLPLRGSHPLAQSMQIIQRNRLKKKTH